MNASHGPHGPCSCSCCAVHPPPGLTRRQFVVRLGATAAGVGLAGPRALAADAGGPPARRALRVQPVLVYSTPVRREGTSWRGWGGIQTEGDADAEVARIGKELARVKASAGVPLDIGPVEKVKSDAAAAEVARKPCDVRILYAAGGGVRTLESLIAPDRDTLMFLRHDPGPVYLWYEIVHPRLLRKTVDEYGQPGLDVHDIAVDDPDGLAWRLRALSGLRNTLGTKIVAIGGASGWGAGGQKAPAIAKDAWKFDIVDVPYAALAPRLQAAMDDPVRRRRAAAEAERLLGGWRVSMKTGRDFLDRAYVMTDVFRELMREAGAGAITVNACMGTIMGISKTTACMPLSFLNDEGWLAFCESDFVVIPSGVLLHKISGLPVFLNDPTTPHGGIVTLAHCTAPRKMDGRRLEPVRILTHFESDYGAAPKVEFRVGQACTNLVPDFANREWIGFEGEITGNPFLDICRSQCDVRIRGDEVALLERMKGFHWMMAYGNHLREVGYALRKAGVGFQNLSPEAKAEG